MTPLHAGRAFVLALCLWIIGAVGAFAHALPGSVLTLSADQDILKLSITLPLEDLIIAAPEQQPIDDLPVGQALPSLVVARLQAYFAKHMKFDTPSAHVPLSLDYVRLQTGENDHVGQFKELVLEFSGPLPDSESVFPILLAYNAVMHEIRNHRTLVLWTASDGATTALAEFGYQKADSGLQTIELVAP